MHRSIFDCVWMLISKLFLEKIETFTDLSSFSVTPKDSKMKLWLWGTSSGLDINCTVLGSSVNELGLIRGHLLSVTSPWHLTHLVTPSPSWGLTTPAGGQRDSPSSGVSTFHCHHHYYHSGVSLSWPVTGHWADADLTSGTGDGGLGWYRYRTRYPGARDNLIIELLEAKAIWKCRRIDLHQNCRGQAKAQW